MKVVLVSALLVYGCVGQDPCEDLPSGTYPNLDKNCTTFLHCDGGATAAETPCPQGLVFDINLGVCNWPYATCPPCGTGEFPSVGSCDNNTITPDPVTTTLPPVTPSPDTPPPDTPPPDTPTPDTPPPETQPPVQTTTTTFAPITSYTVPWSTLPPQECGNEEEYMCLDNADATCETCHQYWWCAGINLFKMACPPPFVIDYQGDPEKDCQLPESACPPCGTLDCGPALRQAKGKMLIPED